MTYGYELSDKQKADFDYIAADEIDSHDFVIYKGMVFDVAEFMIVDKDSEHFKDWDGYSSGSYFHGTLIKIVDSDSVIIGTYYA